MAGSGIKRSKVDEDGNESVDMEESSGEESDEGEMDVEEIQVDFEATCMEASDLQGVQALLRQLLPGSEIVCPLADLLLSQPQVGSVIKQSETVEDSDSDDDDVFGVVSVVDLSDRKDLPPVVKSLREFILSKCDEKKNNAAYQTLNKTLAENQVGLIICERFVNLPMRLALPMYESLRTDMESANSKKKSYKFSHYIILSKMYEPISPLKNTTSAEIYANQEDGYFKEESILNFQFKMSEEGTTALVEKWNGDNEMIPLRQVMLMTADKLNIVINKLREVLQT